MTHLETLQALFKNRAFVIPDYQRGYAWETEQRQDLLNDLEDLQQVGQDKVHYTGTVVLHRGAHESKTVSGSTYEVVDIVDGQQRITTLIILLHCVITLLADFDDEESQETAASLRSEYVERASKQSTLVRLRLNGSSDLFFRDCILGSSAVLDTALPAHINLRDAKQQFTTYLNHCLDRYETPGDKMAFLNDLTRRVTNRLGFVVYEVSDEAEVGVMFEVMNARGRPLTEMEKVKNYLLYLGSRVSDNKDALSTLTQDVNETWVKVLETVMAAGTSGREDQFLRYHWAIYPDAGWYNENKRARTFEIHRAVKNTLNLRVKPRDANYHGVVTYLSSLRALSVSYRDALNPTHPMAFSALRAGKTHVVERATSLQRIGRTATVLPILMAAHHRFGAEAETLAELFRLCETLAFRLAAVEKNANTGDSYAYSIAAEIMSGSVSASKAVSKLQECVNYYCSDYNLKATLLDPTTDFYQWGPIRYFLFEYERHLVEQASKKFTHDWTLFYRKDRNDTIEHILPQGANTLKVAYWKERFQPDTHQAYMNRLGNLCLTDWNSYYSNKPFPDKRGAPEDDIEKKVYRNSRWGMERELCRYVDWTPEAIAERQEKLAAFALVRWRT